MNERFLESCKDFNEILMGYGSINWDHTGIMGSCWDNFLMCHGAIQQKNDKSSDLRDVFSVRDSTFSQVGVWPLEGSLLKCDGSRPHLLKQKSIS